MMKRDSLRSYKRAYKKMDFYPSTEMVHALLDHGLEALDEIERLQGEIRSRDVKLEELRAYHARTALGGNLSDPYFE